MAEVGRQVRPDRLQQDLGRRDPDRPRPDRRLARAGQHRGRAILDERPQARRPGPGRDPGAPEGRQAGRLLPHQPRPGLRQGRREQEGLRGSPRSPERRRTPEAAVDPGRYYFFKAVAEHATMQKDAATGSIVRLLDDVADAPDRYKMVATLMFFEMQNWSPDPKDLIEHRAADGQQRPPARPGPRRREDPGHPEEDRLPPRRADQGDWRTRTSRQGQCNGGNCPDGGQPGSQPGGNTSQPEQPRRRTA